MDLRTNYLGLSLPHPVIASASPLSRTAEGVCKLANAGAAAVILPSLFAEQIDGETSARPLAHIEMMFPGWTREPLGAQEYLDLIALSRRMSRVPIIASLNAEGPGTWTQFARTLAEAGANAVELNLYHVAADSGVGPDAVEQRYRETVHAIRSATTLPLAVKIGPFFSALPHFARRLIDVGADALVLFNRYYEPDFDPETRSTSQHDVVMSLSRRDLRLPMRWTAVLSEDLGNDAQIALTGGVHTGVDVVKAIMAGAAVVEVASELLTRGIDRITGIRAELAAWLQSHGFETSDAIRGLMHKTKHGLSPAASERAGYIDTIRSHEE